MPHLSVQHLTRHFGAFTALQDVSLEVERGELVCFLGPSGCGKTTLLRAIAGLDAQHEGRIEIDGRDVSHAPPAERDFGIVFQSYALFPNLTAAANVGYGLEIRANNRGMSRQDRLARVDELLHLVGLDEHKSKYPSQLSGGQQQRVALARALATRPSLLLLDEPLSALDARERQRLRGEIKHLQRRLGVTTILVTHDQEEALAMADRIVVMNRGSIEQIGTPREIYAEPKSLFVADFIGTMSFVDAVVAGPGRARAGGIELQVDRLGGGEAGRAVRLAIRPEEVITGRDSGDNLLTARIVDSDYLGTHYRVRLHAGDDGTGFPLLADLGVSREAAANVAAGRRLTVTLPAASLRVYPAAVGR